MMGNTAAKLHVRFAPEEERRIQPGHSGMVMESGREYCRHCDAHVLPAGDRIGEGHVAVRFRDSSHNDVYEGDAKLLRAYEVLGGPGGWVVEGIGNGKKAKVCPNCMNAMVRLRFGDNFSVARKRNR